MNIFDSSFLVFFAKEIVCKYNKKYVLKTDLPLISEILLINN
jgi:hypothetical protein